MTGVQYSPRSGDAVWVREGSGQTLDDLMQVDHVIRVDGDGLVHDDVSGLWAPEINAVTDDGGMFTADTERLIGEEVGAHGWEAVRGRSGQYGTKATDVVMHVSEFVGGGLARHIIETPGYWVVCSVEVENGECPKSGERKSDGCSLNGPRCAYCENNGRETESAGWVLLWRPVVHYGESRSLCGVLEENAECVTFTGAVNCGACRAGMTASV